MSSTPFVHSELDDWGLDPYEFRLLFRISRRAGKNGTCTESILNMAKACCMSHNTVRKALATLVRLGMIKSIERPGQTAEYVLCPVSEWKEKTADTPTKSGTTTSGRGTKSGRGTPTKSGRGGIPDQGGVPLPNQGDEGIPIEGIPIKDSLKDKPTDNPMVRPPDGDGPGGVQGSSNGRAESVTPPPIDKPKPKGKPARASPVYAHDDWNYKAASALLEQLTALGALSGIVKKQLAQKDGRENVLQEWANTFRLLQSQDGWTKDEISMAMRWVLRPDNKWMQKRWLQSAASLRQRTQSGDKTKFEAILNQAKSDGYSKRNTGESSDEAQRRLDSLALGAIAA